MPIKVLTFSTLYPNPIRKQHGIFVENRLRQLVGSGEVDARVLAPVPWVPFAHPMLGQKSELATIPWREERYGISIAHPRYPMVPKVSMNIAPFLLYLAVRPIVRRMLEAGDTFELIDAHYFYPDGVAAVLLARYLGLPVCVTARGSDLNVLPQYRIPRRLITWAARHADGLITVCQALKDRLSELGVDEERVRVLCNGVDLTLFRPTDREAERRSLGVSGPLLLSVGNLVELKGHDLVIAALQELRECTLIVAGDGPERQPLLELASRLGVETRVRFLGSVPQTELPRLYSAADALILASSREGWANVLLESMACGTPVIATKVGGTPEVITSPAAGTVIKERSPAAIAAAVRSLFAAPPDRTATRRYAEGFGWDATTRGQIMLYSEILARRRHGAKPP